MNENIDDKIMTLPNYNIVPKDRVSRGGGVALYISKALKFTVLKVPIETCDIDNCSVEFLLVRVQVNHISVVIDIFYKPPEVSYQHLTVTEDIINYLALSGLHSFVFLGDFNIYLFKINCPSVRYFNQHLLTYDCMQHTQQPTRVTQTSQSLLDLIITNSDLAAVSPDVLDVCLSDHNVVKCEFSIRHSKPQPLPKYIISFKDFDHDWNLIYHTQCLDEKVKLDNSYIVRTTYYM